MEDTRFDLLLRRAAQQTSRRATLGALVSGALLLGDLAASEATKKAERRKKRRKQARGGLYRGFYITIDNANGNAPVSIEGGDRGDFNCCRVNGKATIPQRGSIFFRTHRTATWLWLDTGQKYWFQFHNYLGAPPFYRIAVFGQTNEDRDLCCPMPQGVIVERQWSIDENRSRDYNIAGHVFKLTRHSDTKAHKVYTLLLPPDL